MNDWSSLLEVVEFKPIAKGKLIHDKILSIIMTGGLIHVKDNLFWCSEKHYKLLKTRQETRYWDLAASNLEEVTGPMLRQTSKGIRYE